MDSEKFSEQFDVHYKAIKEGRDIPDAMEEEKRFNTLNVFIAEGIINEIHELDEDKRKRVCNVVKVLADREELEELDHSEEWCNNWQEYIKGFIDLRTCEKRFFLANIDEVNRLYGLRKIMRDDIVDEHSANDPLMRKVAKQEAKIYMEDVYRVMVIGGRSANNE